MTCTVVTSTYELGWYTEAMHTDWADNIIGDKHKTTEFIYCNTPPPSFHFKYLDVL